MGRKVPILDDVLIEQVLSYLRINKINLCIACQLAMYTAINAKTIVALTYDELLKGYIDYEDASGTHHFEFTQRLKDDILSFHQKNPDDVYLFTRKRDTNNAAKPEHVSQQTLPSLLRHELKNTPFNHITFNSFRKTYYIKYKEGSDILANVTLSVKAEQIVLAYVNMDRAVANAKEALILGNLSLETFDSFSEFINNGLFECSKNPICENNSDSLHFED